MGSYVKDLVELASNIYNDPISFTGYVIDVDGVRITGADWVEYLNEAFKMLANVRPDASQKTSSLNLVSGVKQTLPADSVMLLQVVRNLGDDGNTPGPPITKASEEDLEAIDPDWYSTTPAGQNIAAYTWDNRMPNEFKVYPITDGNWYVEIEYTFVQSVIEYDDDVVIPPNFDQALIDYMLYLAFSIDQDSVQDRQLAMMYLNKFYSDLGVQAQTKLINAPQDEL